MEVQLSRSSGPSQATLEGFCAKNEPLKVPNPELISAYARYKQIQSLNPSSVHSKQRTITDPLPYAPQLRSNSELSSRFNLNSDVSADTPSIFCSGKVINPVLGSPIEMSRPSLVQCEGRGSFDTNDSALGESLSEADAQNHEPPISRSSLIIKFSTTSPGRINAVERRGPISCTAQARSSSDQGNTLDRHQDNISTPQAQSNKKRGRPLGSKNRNSASKSNVHDRSTGNQRQTSTPSKPPTQNPWDTTQEKKASPALSGAMKTSWAKRRDKRTDGHRGGPPTENTLLKRQGTSSVPNEKHSSTTGQFDRDPQRQLFKGQHAIRSASAPKFPVMAPQVTVDARNMKKAVPYEGNDQDILPVPSPQTLFDAVLPPQSVIPGLCKDDTALRNIFTSDIYPALKKSMIRNQGVLADTTLLAVCKQVANEIVDKRFQTFLRESEYQLGRDQRKRIRRYTRSMYSSKVRHTQEHIESNTAPILDNPHQQAKNMKVAATSDSSSGRSTRVDKQSMANAMHEKNEVTQYCGTREADGQRARPKEAEDATNLLGAVVDTDFTLVERKLSGKLIPESPSQATCEDNSAYQKQHSKTCISCLERGIKCILQGSSCEVCQKSGTKCSFRREDNAPKPEGKSCAVSKTGRGPGQVDLRRCIRCRQRHSKCIPSGGNCEGCDLAGLRCSFRQADLEVQPPSGHWDASASLQSTFTGSIKHQEPRRHGNNPESLHRGSRGQATSSFIPSNLQLHSGRKRESLQGIQISPRKLRGRTETPRDVESARDDLSEDIDWYNTLYPDHGSQQINDKSTSQPSDPVRSQSLGLTKTVHTKLPTASNPQLELAAVHASLYELSVDRPYMCARKGHYDFVRDEYVSLLLAMDSFDQVPYQIYNADTPDLRLQLKARLGQCSEERMTTIITSVRSKPGTALAHRKRKNIRRHLKDLIENTTPPSAPARFAIPQLEVRDPVLHTKHDLGSLLRNRELGYSTIRDKEAGHRSSAQCIDIPRALYQCAAETIRPWRSWKGASSDVVTVAWAHDSVNYAAGAAAQSDDLDLQYNRPRNLLFGDLNTNTISELPDHRVARPRPETVASGPNSTYAVYQACDPMVYKTVTSVHFSPWGGALYTASHDKTVKVWDTASGLPTCSATLTHEAEVTSLELSNHFPGYFATASKTLDDSVCVYRPTNLGSQSGYLQMHFSSPRALKHRNYDIYPECIRWGLTPATKHLLLAGFQQWADQDYSAARQGEVCLWDINTGVRMTVRPHVSAIFSVAWHPYENIFITGGAPGGGVLSFPKTTKSVVRSYDTRNTCNFTHEFECPALDMQDVTFHPNSSNYVTAGCTNGTTYVWDYRWPDEIMHELHHGEPIQELPPNEEEIPYAQHREKVDAGVLLSIWGEGASLFYTGSSDGVIKAWDILRAPEDVWVRDVASLPAGIQSGSLSPDGMNLLVGDAVGGIHVLSAAPFGLLHTDQNDDADGQDYNPDPITFVFADEKKNESNLDNPGTEGIEEANQLMESGQTVLHPSFGVGKGPNYQGPLAEYARWNNLATGYSELMPKFDTRQAFSVNGVEQQEFSEKIRTLVVARREQMLAAKQTLKPFTIALGDPTPFVANKSASSKPATQTIGTDTLIVLRKSTESTNTSHSSPSTPSTPKPSRLLASGTIKQPSLSPRGSIASDAIDLTDDYLVSPLTGNKRRRPSSPRTLQPSTPINPSKRTKMEYESPLRYGYKSPNAVRISDVEVINLTDNAVSEHATTASRLDSQKKLEVNGIAVKKGENGKVALDEKRVVIDLSEEDGEEEVEENLLTWEEWVEEDHWWPTVIE